MLKEELKLLGREYTYIKNCWTEFTRLNFDEMQALEEIRKQFRKFIDCKPKKQKPKINKRKKRIICKETNEVFESIAKAAKYFNVSASFICQSLNYGWKIKRQYSFSKVLN